MPNRNRPSRRSPPKRPSRRTRKPQRAKRKPRRKPRKKRRPKKTRNNALLFLASESPAPAGLFFRVHSADGKSPPKSAWSDLLAALRSHVARGFRHGER